MSSLCIVGGADRNPEIYRSFIGLCHAAAPAVGVIPCASEEPGLSSEKISARLRSAGAGSAVVIDPRIDPDAAQAAAQRVDAIWFTGGDQAKIVECMGSAEGGSLVDGPLLALLRARHSAGNLVLGGTSAGAAVMSSIMIYEGSSLACISNPDTGVHTGPGLGFFPHGIIDQHFDARGRLIRLCAALERHGLNRGFGICEDSALILDARGLRAAGSRGFYLVERRHESEAYHWEISYLEAGDSFSPDNGSVEFNGKSSTHDDEALDIFRPLASGVLSPHGDLRQFIARELLDNRIANLYVDGNGNGNGNGNNVDSSPKRPPYVKSLLLEETDERRYAGAELRFYRSPNSRGYYSADGALAFERVGFSWDKIEMEAGGQMEVRG